MTDTCFANNPKLLAELHSLGAKAAQGILSYLARHKYGGKRQQQQITPNFSHPTKNIIWDQPFLFIFGMGGSILEKLGNSKRRGNWGIKWHKEHRTCFFIKLSLQLHSVVKPFQTPSAQEMPGRAGNLSPLQSSFFPSLCQCHQFKVNPMQCWGWWGSLDFLILPMPLVFSTNTIDMEFFNKKRNPKHLLQQFWFCF